MFHRNRIRSSLAVHEWHVVAPQAKLPPMCVRAHIDQRLFFSFTRARRVLKILPPTMSSSTPPATAAGYDAELELHTIHHDGRDISISCSKKYENLPPVLYFYPVGAGRRMLLAFKSLFSTLRLICINRPGKGGTSPSKKGHLETVVHDVVVVLDSLQINQVSIMTMCAGTPFAMAFATQHPERTTGKFIGISTWIQPADCGYDNTKLLYYIGTKDASHTGPLAGTVMSGMASCFTSFPTSWFAGMLRKKLNKNECRAFDELYSDVKDFSSMMEWMRQDSRGGLNADVQVLLTANVVDYEALSKSQDSICLWHGTNDTMVPYVGAEWLNQQLPNSELKPIPDGTHEGCMFLLHDDIVESLKSLAS